MVNCCGESKAAFCCDKFDDALDKDQYHALKNQMKSRGYSDKGWRESKEEWVQTNAGIMEADYSEPEYTGTFTLDETAGNLMKEYAASVGKRYSLITSRWGLTDFKYWGKRAAQRIRALQRLATDIQKMESTTQELRTLIDSDRSVETLPHLASIREAGNSINRVAEVVDEALTESMQSVTGKGFDPDELIDVLSA